ncbi:MAG: hypothetical protein ACTSQI_19265 [Candidatus Helarchaeota archaeon]
MGSASATKANRYFQRLQTENHGEITVKLNPDCTVDLFIPFIQEVQPHPAKSLLFLDTNERSVDYLLVTERSRRRTPRSHHGTRPTFPPPILHIPSSAVRLPKKSLTVRSTSHRNARVYLINTVNESVI